MQDIPSSYVDAKRFFQNKEPYESPYNVLFTRYSSPHRIVANTCLSGLGGGLYGISWAIYHNQPKLKYFLRCGAGCFAFSLAYSALNEVVNGAVMRKMKKEQLFISNTASAVVTMGLVHLFQKGVQRMETQPSLKRAFKYVGTLCVATMYHEIKIIEQRDYFLDREVKREIPSFSFVNKEGGQRKRIINRDEN